MDDWQYLPPQPITNQTQYGSIAENALDYFLIFIFFATVAISVICIARKMMCPHNKTTNHMNRKSSRKIKMCRCILYSIISLIVATVIFTLFGSHIVHYEHYAATVHLGAVSQQLNMNMESRMALNKNLGFAVGGSKTVNNFRDNIKHNYLPLSSSITYEGLFYEYYFNTNTKQTNECKDLFCPTYASAVTTHPINDNDIEYYLSVGLNSNIGADEFKRKKLNIVIVLDISGSMSSSFNRYYYDNKKEDETLNDDWSKSKLDIAKESIVGLLDHLKDEDRFGMALFDHDAYIAKPLHLIGNTNIHQIKEHIMAIQWKGSTNFEAGYKKGSELFSTLSEDELNDDEYENRIILLTDAMPNTGNINEEDLFALTEKNAHNSKGRIYSTFIGVGIDFNSDLIERITKIRGSNYYAVHSFKEFMNRMKNEFEYMVTPLVFNLELILNSTNNMYSIDEVYGSPEADKSSGTVMKVNTLFPSQSNDDAEVKGGITLLKLNKNEDVEGSTDSLDLMVNYEDRNGETHSNTVSIMFNQDKNNTFESNGIRKAVLLSRYVQLMKEWIVDQRKNNDVNGKNLGVFERQSVALEVNSKYQQRFSTFHQHFLSEMDALGDKSLQQEVDIMRKLGSFEPVN